MIKRAWSVTEIAEVIRRGGQIKEEWLAWLARGTRCAAWLDGDVTISNAEILDCEDDGYNKAVADMRAAADGETK